MLETFEPWRLRTEADARWQPLRRPPRERDRAVTGTTRAWLRRLPPRRRPLRLCIAYPRVANQVAWCWADIAQSAQLIDDLLHDRRGGRRGFPPAVRRELLRLQDFNRQQRVETEPEGLLARLGRVIGVD